MGTLREIGGGLLLALFSAALVIGGISLALAENHKPEIPEVPTETQVLIQILNSPTPVTPKTITATITINPSSTPIATNPSASPTPYVSPTSSKTRVPCGPPSGWVRYTVQAGNTMYSLSHAYGVSISQLQRANCMSSGQYNLTTGQTIWVPNVITRTPRASATPSLTPVSIIFPTITKPATITPTPTQTGTSTTAPTVPPTFTHTATVPPPTTPPTATATITAFPTSNP